MNTSKNNEYRRVVVTGLGVISSIGIGWEEFWKNLIAGKSGISKISSFDTSQYERHFGGEIKNFDATKFMSERKAKRMGRASQLAVAASKLAIKDAQLDLKNIDRNMMGVCIGTTMGESSILEVINKALVEKELDKIRSKMILEYPTNTISANIANEFKLKRNNVMFSTACSAGNYSIGYAFDQIRTHKADLMIAGGVDALSRIAFTGFNRLYAVAHEKCQPFDKNRQGMLIGEGAGILMLESLDGALKRKTRIYAEIGGYHLSCDGTHMTQPSVKGITNCLIKALELSKLAPKEVDYISAHGTGTAINDLVESQAINNVFSSRRKRVPISSIKSMLGHTMGAASAIEALSCCLSIQQSIVPPTINFETIDPGCDIDCVPNISRKISLKTVLNNSYAFGGNNVSLILKKYG